MEAPGLGDGAGGSSSGSSAPDSGGSPSAGDSSWAAEGFSVVMVHTLYCSAPQALRVPTSSPETKIPQSIQINCFMLLSSFLYRLWFPLL